ncbi:hypothetical protein EDC04DRAFT_1656518 [Pisolithus marmoratus]|nr:hypothetical protein EDC04DRAFT_1656518 [Pisolithus marmoratus]
MLLRNHPLSPTEESRICPKGAARSSRAIRIVRVLSKGPSVPLSLLCFAASAFLPLFPHHNTVSNITMDHGTDSYDHKTGQLLPIHKQWWFILIVTWLAICCLIFLMSVWNIVSHFIMAPVSYVSFPQPAYILAVSLRTPECRVNFSACLPKCPLSLSVYQGKIFLLCTMALVPCLDMQSLDGIPVDFCSANHRTRT